MSNSKQVNIYLIIFLYNIIINYYSAQIRVQGIMSSSTQVMHTMNELMRIPELKDTMSKLAREMEKAGLIQELADDAFASIEVTT